LLKIIKVRKDFMNIHPTYTEKVTRQSYRPVSHIDDVEIVRLEWHGDDGGNFTELFRTDKGLIAGLKQPFEMKQFSMSILVPGAIKAYHLHYSQDDLWYVSPLHRLLVNLHDLRKDSPTFDQHQRILLGGGKNALLRIPKGVAHGVANVYQQDMMMFYATSEQFNPAEPDEQRLPWDTFGKDVWNITKG